MSGADGSNSRQQQSDQQRFTLLYMNFIQQRSENTQKQQKYTQIVNKRM